MTPYKLTLDDVVIRCSDMASIPIDPRNADYQRYLADVADGAEVLPADQPPAPEPTASQRVDQLVAASKGAIASAASLADIKAAFSLAMDGLGAIYGDRPG